MVIMRISKVMLECALIGSLCHVPVDLADCQIVGGKAGGKADLCPIVGGRGKAARYKRHAEAECRTRLVAGWSGWGGEWE
jgi:hypothetical protein